MREPLLSPLLSCHQSLDILSLASFEEFDEGKYIRGEKVTANCRPVNLLLSRDVSAKD